MLRHLAGARLENSPGPVVSLPTMRSATRYKTSVVPIVLTATDMCRSNLVGGTWFRMRKDDLDLLLRLEVNGSAMMTSR